MMGVFLSSIHPASAASTEIKTYGYDPPGIEYSKEISIKKGEPLDIAATLHVDGGNPQWFRWIHFYVYNSNNEQIINEERNSGFGGVARCWINSINWEKGTYKVSVIYWGSDDGEWPKAEKEMTLTIE